MRDGNIMSSKSTLKGFANMGVPQVAHDQQKGWRRGIGGEWEPVYMPSPFFKDSQQDSTVGGEPKWMSGPLHNAAVSPTGRKHLPNISPVSCMHKKWARPCRRSLVPRYRTIARCCKALGSHHVWDTFVNVTFVIHPLVSLHGSWTV